MNDLEKMLAEQLSATDDLAAPRVDVAGLARAGRAERRRRRGIGVAVAAAVAVVAATTATSLVVGGSDKRVDQRPGPADRTSETDRTYSSELVSELPLGDASTAPWFDRKTLHAGGTTYDFDQRDLYFTSYAAGTTVTTVKRDGLWRGIVLRDGESTELVSSSGSRQNFRLAVSADGRTVAVGQRVAGTEVELTTYGAGSATPLGSTTFSGPGTRPSFSLLNVTNDGRVVVSLDKFFVWSPGTQPVAVALSGTVAADGISYPGGIAMSDGGQRGVYGSISADGRFDEVGELELDAVTWSPSGVSWTYTTSDGEQGGDTFIESADRDAVILPMPHEFSPARTWGWEDQEHVVIEGTTSAGDDLYSLVQVRCDVVELTCERIPLDR